MYFVTRDKKGAIESHDFLRHSYIIRGWCTLISGSFCSANSSVEPPSHRAPGFMVPRSPLYKSTLADLHARLFGFGELRHIMKNT